MPNTNITRTKPTFTPELLAKAEAGDKHAQYQVGTCFMDGLGVEKDCEKAVYWFHKAANQGLADAQNDLGYCYSSGEGVEKDFMKGYRLYQAAARQGHQDARLNVAMCLKLGRPADNN